MKLNPAWTTCTSSHSLLHTLWCVLKGLERLRLHLLQDFLLNMSLRFDRHKLVSSFDRYINHSLSVVLHLSSYVIHNLYIIFTLRP